VRGKGAVTYLLSFAYTDTIKVEKRRLFLLFHGTIERKTQRRLCKMSSSKNLTRKGTVWQVFNCQRAPPLLGVCLGWSSNFIGSESGQIQSVKLLQNMVSHRKDSRSQSGGFAKY
jgi:hypothetical protein